MLIAVSDSGTLVNVRHLFIEGTSQWVIGRNVTCICSIIHIGHNVLQLPEDPNDADPDFISLVDHGLHSYVPYHAFVSHDRISPLEKTTIFCATAQLPTECKDSVSPNRSWPQKKASFLWYIDMCVVNHPRLTSRFSCAEMVFGTKQL